MFKIACILTGVLTSTQAMAESWVFVGETDESKYYIDSDRIQTINEYGKNYQKIWVKELIYNDITKDGLTVGDYYLQLFQIDCKNQMFGMKVFASYKNNGHKIESEHLNRVSMRDAIPGSIGDSVVQYACNRL